jgi:hypothetical protein
MPPPAHPPADLHGKSMEKAEKPAQKASRKPKGQPKPPNSKEEAERKQAEQQKIVGSNAWAKKKKKADQKQARKNRRRLQGPLYPYSIKINWIEIDTSLTLKEWHGVHTYIVRWIASEIMAASDNVDFSGLKGGRKVLESKQQQVFSRAENLRITTI